MRKFMLSLALFAMGMSVFAERVPVYKFGNPSWSTGVSTISLSWWSQVTWPTSFGTSSGPYQGPYFIYRDGELYDTFNTSGDSWRDCDVKVGVTYHYELIGHDTVIIDMNILCTAQEVYRAEKPNYTVSCHGGILEVPFYAEIQRVNGDNTPRGWVMGKNGASSWLHFYTSGGNPSTGGTGNGTKKFVVDQNPTPWTRTATVTISPNPHVFGLPYDPSSSFTITQCGSAVDEDGVRWECSTNDDGTVSIGCNVDESHSAVARDTAGAVVVPSALNGGRVTRIGAGAFDGCDQMTSVVIPEGVEEIDARAFGNCGALTEVTIPASVTMIGDGVFSGCSSLTTVWVEAGDADRIRGLLNEAGRAFAVVPTVTVTFVSEDNEYAVMRYPKGGTLDTLPAAPARRGFDFLGWYTAEEGGKLVVQGSQAPDAPTTLYARWDVKIREVIEFSGRITSNTTWTFGNLYKLTGAVTVDNGATLTIEPGVVVKFPARCGMTITRGSRLVAPGLRGSPIVFTSLNDDASGGKTIGSNSSPQGGDWNYIDVAGVAELSYCKLMYGGPSNERGLIQTNGGTLTMDACTVAHSKYDGVWNWGGSVTVRNSVITDVGLAAAPYRGSKNEYDNCVFYGCQYILMYWSSWTGRPIFTNCVFMDMSMGWTDTNSSSLDFRNGCTFKNCCFWNEPGLGRQSCAKSTCFYADPLFLDPENGNFRVAANSPCIDVGLGEFAPERDYYGQPRMEVDGVRKSGTVAANGKVPDIGIYEVPGGSDVPAADLVVTVVSAPEELSVGGTAKISWTVANNGTYEAFAGWRDAVELVTANGQSVLLGTFMGDVDLAPGKTANFSLTATIPSALEGACTVRVTANKYRDVFECFAYDNNAADAAPSVLTVGDVTLPTSGDAYPLALAAGCETAFRLGNATDQAAVIVVRSEGELSAWLGNGAVATRDNAIRSAVKAADGTWLLQVASGEEPRISVANEGESAATCELSLAVGDFFLLDTGKVTAGNGGTASLAFYGNGFDETMSCWLTQGSVRIDAVSVKVDDAVSATAIFDLTDAAPGDYMLHVKKGDDEATATVLSVVQTKIGAKWNCSVDIAESIRPSRVYVGRLNYSNDGDTAMRAPYVRLTSNRGTLIRLSEADAWGTSIELMAASDTYPAGTLKPGDSSRVSFFYMTTADAAEITYAYTLSSDGAFPWAEAQTEMKPASVTDAAWAHAFRTLRANLGETWNDYLERMRADCDHLQAIGSLVKRLDRIWQLEIADAMGTDAAVPTLVTATDLARSARGLGLSFVRTYSSSMSKRFDSGILGYGWADNYSSYVEQMDAETLVFHLPSGGSYGFTKASGSWQPEDARDKTKLAETDAAYVLTYASGTVQTFSKSNMKTAAIADNQGRALTFTYAGDLLTRVTHTDGAALDFTYSGGNLVSVADDQGRTTTYGYTGDLLTTVTAYNGLVTRYEYQSATGTPNDRALTRIVYPDGTTKEFAYDAKGLLAETSVNGGQQPTRIVRNPLGSYTIVAPNGGETRVTVGANGETLKTVNALGETVKQVYTADSLLESTVAPSGKRNKVTYDKQGSPIASMSASGATTAFAYTSEFDNLASVTDAKGHAFTYGYDELGRSTSVGYADGSASTLEYNEKGDVVKSTNRRGESVVYEYDDEGNLVRKTWDNGRTFTLAYDDQGNVTNATDSVTGTVTMEYDANERLTRIVHPKNRGFTFKYDASGRQIERASLDGTKECYEYDAFGRLARVTDGASAYLTNAYDPTTGWLVTQTYGNGTVVSNAYDLLGRTVGIYHLKNGVRLAFFEYAYDSDGKCLSQTTAEGTESYTYDADGQLTGVTYPDGTSEAFAYDAVGNRTLANSDTYVVNNLNQYTTISTSTSTSFTYDLDGNLTSRTDADGTTTYAYDTLNRLVAVTNEAKNIRWSCEYDVFGNRTSVTDNGTTTEKLFVQGSLASVAAEYVNDAQTSRHIVVGAVRLADLNGEAASSPLDQNPPLRYYHADLLGSTRLTTDASGTQQGTASYKAFGALRKSSGTQTDAGYVGTLGIETDANGFLFMRNRYYDAGMGRFVQMDPIGLKGGKVNVYQYCDNEPSLYGDFTGLAKYRFERRSKPMNPDAEFCDADHSLPIIRHDHIMVFDENNNLIDNFGYATTATQDDLDKNPYLAFWSKGEYYSYTNPSEINKHCRLVDQVEVELEGYTPGWWRDTFGSDPGHYSVAFANCKTFASDFMLSLRILKKNVPRV